MTIHTDREYEAELHRLHEQILLMGAKVEEMIASSMRALIERDSDLARKAALVFVDEQAEVQAGNAPLPTASVKKLKQILLKADEKSRLSREQIKTLAHLFEK